VPTSASEQGRLAAGATASAPVRWSGSCVAPVGTVEVNWGAGDVDVRPTGVPQRKCPAGNRPSDLRVGAFTGLS
jgi:hypothetical protein